MKPLVAEGEKASVYPQKYHWKITTALLADTAQMSDTGWLLEICGTQRQCTYGHFSDATVQSRGMLQNIQNIPDSEKYTLT